MTSTRGAIYSLAASAFGVAESVLNDETHLVADLGGDSLRVIEFMMTLRDAFGIVLTRHDIVRMTVLGSVCELVEDRLRVKCAAAQNGDHE